MLLDALSSLSEIRQTFGSKLLKTVESVESILDPGNPASLLNLSPSKQNLLGTSETAATRRAAVYKELLVESQYQHLKAFKECENFLRQREEYIEQLKQKIGDEDPPRSPNSVYSDDNFTSPLISTSLGKSISFSSSHADEQLASDGDERTDEFIKRNLEEKFEALCECRMYKETTVRLQQQMVILKNSIRSQEESRLKLEKMKHLLEQKQQGNEHAIEDLAHEYSSLCSEFEEKSQQSKELEVENDSLKDKIAEQQKLIDSLLSSDSLPVRTENVNANLASPATRKLRRYQQLLTRVENCHEKEVQNLESKFHQLEMSADTTKTEKIKTFGSPPDNISSVGHSRRDEEDKILELERKIAALSMLNEDIRGDVSRVEVEIRELEKFKSEQAEKLDLQVEQVEEYKREVDDLNNDLHKKTSELLQSQSEVKEVLEERERFKEMYQNECSSRRNLHNQICDLKGNIRVYCRIRPVLRHEQGNEIIPKLAVESLSSNEVTFLGVEGKSKRAPTAKMFEFSSVFGPESTQETVFKSVEPLVTSVVDGFDVCLFAYGQTGSGKTHTMEGTNELPGVNRRTLRELFRFQRENSQQFKVMIKLSVLEIYNETVVDLLEDPREKSGTLDIRLNEEGRVHVPGLKCVECSDVSAAETLMSVAQENRKVGSHSLNERSSRSHLVVKLQVSSKNVATGVETIGNLSLIDLAGSERLSKTEATGSMLKETQSINKSLSALGDVIHALQEKNSHIPFRNSKLTYLLQDCLKTGSGGKVAMFVNLSPVAENANETLCSLKFAARCSSLELGQAKENSNASEEIMNYKKKIVELQNKLSVYMSNNPKPANSPRRKTIISLSS